MLKKFNWREDWQDGILIVTKIARDYCIQASFDCASMLNCILIVFERKS